MKSIKLYGLVLTASAVAFLILLVIVWRSDLKAHADAYQALNNLATACGFVLAVGLAFAALHQATTAREANEISALTLVHDRINGESTYSLRRYIQEEFSEHLRKAIAAVEDEAAKQKISLKWLGPISRDVDLEAVKNFDVPEETRAALHKRFHDTLKSIQAPARQGQESSALHAVEMLLVNLDLLAVAHCSANQSMKAALKAWRPVVENSADALIPFVVIERQLRSHSRTNYQQYRWHYLEMLADWGLLQNYDVTRYRVTELV